MDGQLSLVPHPARVLRTAGPGADLSAGVRFTGDREAITQARRLFADHGLIPEPGMPILRSSPATSGETSGTNPPSEVLLDLRLAPGGPAESYVLVSQGPTITITAPDPHGLQHGIHTLIQLVAQDGSVPAIRIVDAPRFAHRGLSLDVGRHFFPVETVSRLLDQMAALKLNVLHLHLTDDQGWRLQLASHPELAARGSSTSALGDVGGHYTTAEYQRIIAYAADLHIMVIPEIDVPGHTHAVSLSHPELVAEPVLSPSVMDTIESFGGGVPISGHPYTGFAVGFSSLRIHDEATWELLADVFGELAELTPGPYVHIGGDEALGTPSEDYAEFVTRATALVAATGKIPIAWHEAGAASDLTPGTIGQYWGFVVPTDGMDDKARAFVDRGGRLILSPADALYLDLKYDDSTPLGLTWANGTTSVERSYSWEPTEVVDGIEEDDILGIEAAVWTETMSTEEDLQVMVFPRLASAAEIGWSPRSEHSWESFRTRLAGIAHLWESAGVHFTRAKGIPWLPPWTS